MALFLSTFVNKIDKKGRVSVPSTFRATLADQPFQGVVLFPSFTARCIEGCDMSRMGAMAAGADGLAAFSAEQDDLTALIFSEAKELPWDGEGRIMLPEKLIEFAGLGEQASFVGKGPTFQIWNPDAFTAVQEEIRARAQSKRPTLNMRRDGDPA